METVFFLVPRSRRRSSFLKLPDDDGDAAIDDDDEEDDDDDNQMMMMTMTMMMMVMMMTVTMTVTVMMMNVLNPGNSYLVWPQPTCGMRQWCRPRDRLPTIPLQRPSVNTFGTLPSSTSWSYSGCGRNTHVTHKPSSKERCVSIQLQAHNSPGQEYVGYSNSHFGVPEKANQT